MERALFIREHNDGLYRPIIYLVSTALASASHKPTTERPATMHTGARTHAHACWIAVQCLSSSVCPVKFESCSSCITLF